MTMFYLIYLLTALIFFGLQTYVFSKLPLSSKRSYRNMLALVSFMHALAVPLPFVARRVGWENPWTDAIITYLYPVYGAFFLVLPIVLIIDLIRAMRALLLWKWNEPTDLRKRRFLQKFVGYTSVTALAYSVGGIFTARTHAIQIERVQIPIQKWTSKKSLRIAQISDLHIGPQLKRDFTQAVVGKVMALKPDLIAITGDLVDGTTQYIGKDVAPLQNLKAPLGTYFVTGNHEYYSGVHEWTAFLQELDITVLQNEHRILQHQDQKFVLAGIHDFKASSIEPSHHSDPNQALHLAPKNLPQIMLAHQPASIFEVSKAGADLQISGHTHGGQYFPYMYAAALANPYLKGLYLHDYQTWIYVNRGTGYWGPPNRIGSPAEITLLEITSA
jgi:uncharacterized protein